MDTKFIFGIWQPGKGWLMVKDDFVSSDNQIVAAEIAKNIGGRVRFMDSNRDINLTLQTLYLQRESRSLCHYFKSLFARKANK